MNTAESYKAFKLHIQSRYTQYIADAFIKMLYKHYPEGDYFSNGYSAGYDDGYHSRDSEINKLQYEHPEVEFDENELLVLYDMLNERILKSKADGITRDHPSAVFRKKLQDKLTKLIIAERMKYTGEHNHVHPEEI